MGEGRAGLDQARREPAPPCEIGVPVQPVLNTAECGQGDPRPRLERICVAGVYATSSLGRAIDQALAGRADAIFDAIGGFHGSGGLVLDLHGVMPAGPGRRWRLVDCCGVPLLADHHALEHCHQAPFTAALFLIEQRGFEETWTVLAEAHLSSAVRYRRLLDRLSQAACDLLRAGLRADGPGRPWTPLAQPRPRWLPRARCRAYDIVTWLRARLGGDLYGIAVLPATAASLLQDAVIAPEHWIAIPAREGFIADPFFWPGRPDIVLCEYYAHATGRGVLSAVPIRPASEPSPATHVLEADHHLSYPFTFLDGDRILCLPEMAADRRQVLYEVRADQSLAPLCTIADDIAMADPTLTRHDGRYWIAYTDADRDAYDNLCLMFATHLTGPWRQHPGNPVKIDVRSSRPGGTPFPIDGRWYRPAQDCSRTYGGALTINAIQTWTTTHYAETPIATLRPDPGGQFPDGLHTLSVQDGRILVDGKRISYNPAIVWNKLRRRLTPRYFCNFRLISKNPNWPALAKK